MIGGGPGGLGAAGAAKGTDPNAETVVYTQFEDVAYSPCGIPFVHGKEIDSFDRLFLATKEQYVKSGIDVRYETTVTSIDRRNKTINVESEGNVRYDKLVLCSGWNYKELDIPGNDLGGIYRVKNIRSAMEWDKFLDSVKTAVIVECGPIAVEMVSAMVHRGIKTTVIDPNPWPMSDAVDPEIIEPVRKDWEEAGVDLKWGETVTAFCGTDTVTHVETTFGDVQADIVILGTPKVPNNALAQASGLKIGSTGGIIIDARCQTSDPDIYAAGDCAEVVHGVTNLPLQGLTGSHAYAQGKVAGVNAAGGERIYQPVHVPWGMLAGEWMIGGFSFGETSATAVGLDYVCGQTTGITRARYYPGVRPITVKILVDPKTRGLLGAQMIGGEGVKERADFLGVCSRAGLTIDALATMENVYSPAIGALNEPIQIAAQDAVTKLDRKG
jgi:NADH oxidase (H2O2-forming)